MINAVTFDYWRTLIWEPAGELERLRLDHWASVLETAGHAIPRNDLALAHTFAFTRASAAWLANEQYRAEHAAADMIARLGVDVSVSVREQLVDTFSRAGLETPLKVAPGVADALVGLRSGGVAVGIVCDVGLTPSPVLRDHLQRNGLLAMFDHWSFSDETGSYKPDSGPFLHACKGLGSNPASTAHVGDQRRTDVVGAVDVGLIAVRYAGIFDDRNDAFPSGDIVITHHDQLLGALGIG